MSDVANNVTLVISLIMAGVALISAMGSARKDAVSGLQKLVETLQKQVENYQKEIEELSGRVDELESENLSLKEENNELRRVVKEQAQEIGALQRRLDDAEGK